MEEIAELARQLNVSGHLATGALVLARVSPLVILAPFLGGPAISAVVRTVAALVVAVAVYPSAYNGPLESVDAGVYVLLMVKEMTVGACLGMLAAIAFHTLSMAGQLIDQSRGTQNASVRSFYTGDDVSPLASLHLQLGVVLFLLMGGHRAFIAAVAGSYELVPVDTLPLSPEGSRAVALFMAQLVGNAIAGALMLAAPAVAAIVLTDVALGVLGRTAPQVGTYFMAMPLRAAVGLAMALLSLSFVLDEIVPYLEGVLSVVRQTSELLQVGP